MTEQRKNVEDPSRNPETLGEGVLIDAFMKSPDFTGTRADAVQNYRDFTENDPEQPSAPTVIAALIDSRFAPLIAAAEDVVEHWEEPLSANAYVTFEKLMFTLRAAIANAKGAK